MRQHRSVSQTFFERENPETVFSYPEEPSPVKTFTGQKKLTAGSLSVATGVALCSNTQRTQDIVQLSVTNY